MSEPRDWTGSAVPADKPFSPSCERNREPILGVLREHLAGARHVLEVGSGTGQHAVHFAAAMPGLVWQCSDRAESLTGIRAWLDAARLPNTPAPVELDVASADWPAAPPSRAVPVATGHVDATPTAATGNGGAGQAGHIEAGRVDTPRFDAVFSANTLHIMGWSEVEAFFAGVDCVLAPAAGESDAGGGTLVVYGPFNYAGEYTSPSNREFDGWLQARDPRSGLRDFEAVDALARGIGLRLVADVAMPANNRCLVWQRHRNRGPG